MQDPDLVLTIISESKAVLSLNAIRKTEDGDLPPEPNKNSLFYFRHPKQTLQMEKDGS
ncbi:unnamed protein product [Hymenolepis diminuta]|uniref:Uncharacterized protein n=1 Tax=Hymenolepis diminuta TaxID=6216 RepID=A0A564Y9B6_HYMDI|nr:unnamed protein product [Hymenolepis diminuta]